MTSPHVAHAIGLDVKDASPIDRRGSFAAAEPAEQHHCAIAGLVGSRTGTSQMLDSASGHSRIGQLRRRAEAQIAPIIRRKSYDDAAVRGKAGELSKTKDKGAAENYVEAKILLRAEELFGAGSADSDANYYQAKREVDSAWAEYQKLVANEQPTTLDWTVMENALSTDEYQLAVERAAQHFLPRLENSRDMKTVLADIRKDCAGIAQLAKVVDKAEELARRSKAGKEVFDQQSATATASLTQPLVTMGTIGDLTKFCEHVAKIHGVSPLNTIEDFVNNSKNNIPLQATTSQQDRSAAIKAVHSKYNKVDAMGVVAPQPIDAGGRLTSDKKANVGPAATHSESLVVEGNPDRQLVLGVGRPGDPQGYQDFAKDYGMWDYESWGAWNKPSAQYSKMAAAIDPNNGADVDKVLTGKDDKGLEIFDKLHFRLTGVFPTITNAADKLVAALGLYFEMTNTRGALYHDLPINPLWTLGEIWTIAWSPDLQNKTAFYGQDGAEQNKKMADLIPVLGDPTKFAELITKKAEEFNKIGEDVDKQLVARYPVAAAGNTAKLFKARKRVADMYFNLTRGVQFVADDAIATAETP